MKKRIFSLILALLLLTACLLPTYAAEAAQETTILFTHDLHSHFLPQAIEDGEERGGYARLKTAIDTELANHPNALIVDGGDFSIGSLIQTLYVDHAAELRTMGAMGFDAAMIGNHEFDHEGDGFAQMLRSAVTSGDALPKLVISNYTPEDTDVQAAMDEYGVTETTIIERGGVTYGLFGIMGQDSHECAPTSGFIREDAVAAAQRCVSALKKQGAEFIICLSHSGTGHTLPVSEDEELARSVDGIDVIVSAHTHTTLTEPIIVNSTYIVSAGSNCTYLGVLTLRNNPDGSRSHEYRLEPINSAVAEDPEMLESVNRWKNLVSETYLQRYHLSYDQVLTTSAFDLTPPETGIQAGNHIGEIVADAYMWAVENLEAEAPNMPTITIAADGVLRSGLAAGDITTSQAFDVLSMGVGEDGTSGFPLVAVYLTGKEIKAAIEVDASVTPIMPAAQLFMSGVKYGFNTNRMFFNRMTDAWLCEPWWTNDNGAQGLAEIDDEALYRVVSGMYSAQMLSTVKGKSMGLLSLEPKYADGTPVDDFTKCILRDADGNEIKEWYALAAYLESFGEGGLAQRYAATDGRKMVSRSWNPVELLRGANWITLLVIAVALLLIALIVLIIIVIRRAVRRCKAKKRK